MSEIDLSSLENNNIDIQLENPPTPPNSPVNNIPQSFIPPTPIIENTIERRRIMLTIQRYILEFSHYLPEDLNKSDLSFLSETQLTELLNEIKFTICCRNSGKMGERAIYMSILQFENFCVNFTPLKVKGLSGICSDQDFIDTAKEFSLENMSMFYVSSGWRLAYSISAAILQLHTLNSEKEMKTAIVKEPIKPIAELKMSADLKEIDDQFNDI